MAILERNLEIHTKGKQIFKLELVTECGITFFYNFFFLYRSPFCFTSDNCLSPSQYTCKGCGKRGPWLEEAGGEKGRKEIIIWMKVAENE